MAGASISYSGANHSQEVTLVVSPAELSASFGGPLIVAGEDRTAEWVITWSEPGAGPTVTAVTNIQFVFRYLVDGETEPSGVVAVTGWNGPRSLCGV